MCHFNSRSFCSLFFTINNKPRWPDPAANYWQRYVSWTPFFFYFCSAASTETPNYNCFSSKREQTTPLQDHCAGFSVKISGSCQRSLQPTSTTLPLRESLMLLSWIRSAAAVRDPAHPLLKTAADTDGAALTLVSWGECSTKQLVQLIHTHDGTMERTDTQPPFHLQTLQPPTASATTKRWVILLQQFCCNSAPLHTRPLLIHICGKTNFCFLCFFHFIVFRPLAPHAALLEFCSAFLADVSLNQPSPPHYCARSINTGGSTITHRKWYIPSQITASHPQHLISSIFHSPHASMKNLCHIGLCCAFTRQIFSSRHKVQNNYSKCDRERKKKNLQLILYKINDKDTLWMRHGQQKWTEYMRSDCIFYAFGKKFKKRRKKKWAH